MRRHSPIIWSLTFSLVMSVHVLLVSPSHAAAGYTPLTITKGQVIMGIYDESKKMGKVFPQTLLAYGGQNVDRYRWRLTPGRSWPVPGISLNAESGVISGENAKIVPGTKDYTVYVTVKGGATPATNGIVYLHIDRCTSVFDINAGSALCPELSFQTVAAKYYLPAGKANYFYAANVYAAGGTPPYFWDLVKGRMPKGMVFDSAFGLIRGTPSVKGASTFVIRISERGGKSTTSTITFVVK